VLEGGTFGIAVGASSRDIRLTTTVDVAAPPMPVALDGMSTLEEWLAHPTGGPLLREAVGTDDGGRPRGILGDQELLGVIGNFPVSTLAAFPGMGITHAAVDDLVARLKGAS
jgi:beta-glucosidase